MQELLILPLGLLPIYFFLVIFGLATGNNILQKYIGDRFRYGKTEYPLELSLTKTRKYESLKFTPDGQQVILFLNSREHIKSIDDALNFFRLQIKYSRDKLSDEEKIKLPSCDAYKICEFENFNVTEYEKGNKFEQKYIKLVIDIDESVVQSREYISCQINSIGRVLEMSLHNGHFYLSYGNGDKNTLYEESGRLYVKIYRVQNLKGFFGSYRHKMSKWQITRNLRNRLWGRFDIIFTSIDEEYYYGELVKRN